MQQAQIRANREQYKQILQSARDTSDAVAKGEEDIAIGEELAALSKSRL